MTAPRARFILPAMTPRRPSRKEAVEKLRAFGIVDEDVYLIDVIPLIEMIWADGKKQMEEVALLDLFVRRHVERINRAAKHPVISVPRAHEFTRRFLDKRPDPQLLSELRSLVAPVRLANADDPDAVALRDCMLTACLDIASSTVTQYPFAAEDRFNLAEKLCFFEILESLGGA